jgi:hypothetical protein
MQLNSQSRTGNAGANDDNLATHSLPGYTAKMVCNRPAHNTIPAYTHAVTGERRKKTGENKTPANQSYYRETLFNKFHATIPLLM